MYFDIHIPVIALSLLGVLFIFTLLLVTVYRSRLRLPVKCRERREAESIDPSGNGFEPVSVVVYARDNSARLEKLLDDLLNQDYPAGYEIIVVNDSGGYACSDVVTRLALTHNNLRMTFVPDKAHNLSRKKLAVTLGLKAARNPFVLLLNAECRLPSRLWLANMVYNHCPVTLGQAVIAADDDSQLPLMMRLDDANTAITWISAAERRRPFRGNGYNMAYNASTFFDHDGFSGSLNLQAGDDDLFINKITNESNTCVALSADSIVRITTSRPRELYRQLKISHNFTGRSLPSHPVISLAPAVLWLSIFTAIATAWLAYPNMIAIIASVLLLLIQWITLGIAWSKASKAVGLPLSGWQALPALLWLPFHNLRYRMASRRNSSQHYTWQKQKKI